MRPEPTEKNRHHVDGRVHLLTGEEEASGDSMVTWMMLSWKSLRPGIHVDVTLTTYTLLQIKYTLHGNRIA